MLENLPEWRQENRWRSFTIILSSLVFEMFLIWFLWLLEDSIKNYLTELQIFIFLIVLGSVYGFLLGLLAIKIWPDNLLLLFKNRNDTYIHIEHEYEK